MKSKFNVRILCAVVSILFLFACGGGGGSGANTDTGSGGTGPAITVLEGTFIDSPVEGLKYETNTQTGITDSNGTFRYQEGETIEFYLGDIFIGDSIAKTIITPIDLVDGATDETHPTVTNICRLLQSLDYDGDLNNGIQITLQIRNEIGGRPIDFNLSTIEFETNTDVVALFVTLNAIGAFSDGNVRTLRTAEQAQTHLRQTIETDDGSHDGVDDGVTVINGFTFSANGYFHIPQDGDRVRSEIFSIARNNHMPDYEGTAILYQWYSGTEVISGVPTLKQYWSRDDLDATVTGINYFAIINNEIRTYKIETFINLETTSSLITPYLPLPLNMEPGQTYYYTYSTTETLTKETNHFSVRYSDINFESVTTTFGTYSDCMRLKKKPLKKTIRLPQKQLCGLLRVLDL